MGSRAFTMILNPYYWGLEANGTPYLCDWKSPRPLRMRCHRLRSGNHRKTTAPHLHKLQDHFGLAYTSNQSLIFITDSHAKYANVQEKRTEALEQQCDCDINYVCTKASRSSAVIVKKKVIYFRQHFKLSGGDRLRFVVVDFFFFYLSLSHFFAPLKKTFIVLSRVVRCGAVS